MALKISNTSHNPIP